MTSGFKSSDVVNCLEIKLNTRGDYIKDVFIQYSMKQDEIIMQPFFFPRVSSSAW